MSAVVRRIPVLLLAGVALLAGRSEVLAQGCAMCRTALGDGDDPLTRGFYWSVLLLMAAPYTVFAIIGGWLVYRHLAAKRAAAGGDDEPRPGRPVQMPAPDAVTP
jgi:hypothetical protein